jgi:hypothetical protein
MYTSGSLCFYIRAFSQLGEPFSQDAEPIGIILGSFQKGLRTSVQ